MSQKSKKLKTSQSDKAIDDLVGKCVRYILLKMSSNIPIKRNDLIKHVFQDVPNKYFEVVFKQAMTILKDTYGLRLEILEDNSSTKKYIITNALEYPELVHADESDKRPLITYLVLLHVFMSKNSSTELSLWLFLKEFNITQATELPGVGTAETFIWKTLLKQQYISLEETSVLNENDDDEKKMKISWGPRADQTVSKMDLLKFVSKVYGGQDIKSWTAQYEDAKEQFGVEIEEELMDDS